MQASIVATRGRFADGITSTGTVYRYERPNPKTCEHAFIWSVQTLRADLCMKCGYREAA